jgi:hypothetical protein
VSAWEFSEAFLGDLKRLIAEISLMYQSPYLSSPNYSDKVKLMLCIRIHGLPWWRESNYFGMSHHPKIEALEERTNKPSDLSLVTKRVSV